jgi:hypothetical protein
MGVLLMLMTIGGLIFAFVLLLIALITKTIWLRDFVFGGVAVWIAFYTVMLLGFSLMSTEKILTANEAKQYCGFYIDCHMHTAVTHIRTRRTIGGRAAKGIFYIVNVKVFSDARNPTIALHLIEPKARVLLANGGRIERDTAAEAMLSTATVRLDTDIHNNETIEKEIVFDLPRTNDDARLLITEGYGIDKTIEHVLVDDEDSIFHAQTFFKLQEQNETAGVK